MTDDERPAKIAGGQSAEPTSHDPTVAATPTTAATAAAIAAAATGAVVAAIVTAVGVAAPAVAATVAHAVGGMGRHRRGARTKRRSKEPWRGNGSEAKTAAARAAAQPRRWAGCANDVDVPSSIDAPCTADEGSDTAPKIQKKVCLADLGKHTVSQSSLTVGRPAGRLVVGQFNGDKHFSSAHFFSCKEPHCIVQKNIRGASLFFVTQTHFGCSLQLPEVC